MSVTYTIPHQARFIPTSNTVRAVYNNNVDTPGFYNFESNPLNNVNEGLEVLELKQGSTYLIERMSVGGTISESVFNSALPDAGLLVPIPGFDIPKLTLKRKSTKEIIYKLPTPIVNYIDDQDVTAWVHSDKSQDFLTIDMTGVLQQTSELVGVAEIDLFISFSIYVMESTVYNNYFFQGQSKNMGSSLVTGIR